MDERTIQVMTSHKSDEWRTPQWFVDKLEKELNIKFSLDPCATSLSAKAPEYYTHDDNGLVQDWSGHNVFVNPPYSSNKDWIKKCYEEGQKPNTLIALLIPVRSDTRYFHQYCLKSDIIYFIKGRLKFESPDMEQALRSNTSVFPSMVVIFDSVDKESYKTCCTPIIRVIDNKPWNKL